MTNGVSRTCFPSFLPSFSTFFFLFFFSLRSRPTSWYVARTKPSRNEMETARRILWGGNVYRRKEKKGQSLYENITERVTKRRSAILPRVTKHQRQLCHVVIVRHRRHYANFSRSVFHDNYIGKYSIYNTLYIALYTKS